MPFDNTQRGIRKASAIVALAAANTPLTLRTIPAGRSAIIRKIKWENLHTTQGGQLRIGTGPTPVAVAIPSTQVLNNSSGELDERNIPEAIINATAATAITCETTANLAAAPAAAMNVQIEIEEYPAG